MVTAYYHGGVTAFIVQWHTVGTWDEGGTFHHLCTTDHWSSPQCEVYLTRVELCNRLHEHWYLKDEQ